MKRKNRVLANNILLDSFIAIVYVALWIALVVGFFCGDFSGLQISFFSLAVIFIWNLIEDYKYTAEKEVVDTIIKNTDFNLNNIEDFLFASHEDVIINLNEIIDDPKNEFRKYRIEYLLERYIYSIPLTYKAKL